MESLTIRWVVCGRAILFILGSPRLDLGQEKDFSSG